jgi:allograft inflammatory factor 1
MTDRTKNLPKSGKEFGELKQRQENDLDSILREFATEAEPSALEKYKQMFLTYDLDGSGDIDLMELKCILIRSHKEVEIVLEILYDPLPCDLYIALLITIDMLEKMGQAKTQMELKKMITEVDSTGKGTINFRDFLKMMTGAKSSILKKILMFEELAKQQNPEPPKGAPPKKSLSQVHSLYLRSLTKFSCHRVIYIEYTVR